MSTGEPEYASQRRRFVFLSVDRRSHPSAPWVASKDEGAVAAAAVGLKDAGVAHHDAIGVLVLDEHGKVKTHKMGSHSFYKGAGIGLILGLLGPVGVGLGIGVGMGAATGGLLGLLHHKGLGLHDSDRERIGTELADGKAAVGVLAGLDEAPSIESVLTESGGVSESHTVSDEALEEVADAAPAPSEAAVPTKS